jgi:endogenous inhibitor of DNA gyrase (YacG/DUF329 family)
MITTTITCGVCTRVIDSAAVYFVATLATHRPSSKFPEKETEHFCCKRCRRLWLIQKANEEQQQQELDEGKRTATPASMSPSQREGAR